MAENIISPEAESNPTQEIVRPRFIKPVFHEKPVYKSEIGLMISYNPTKNCKIRVPAYDWDSVQKYGENTPYRYMTAQLGEKLKELDGVSVGEPYLDYGFTQRNLVGLEYAVTPVDKTREVMEIIDYFMNDKDVGMNCDYHPFLKYTLYVKKSMITKTDSRPLKLGSVYGFVAFDPTSTKMPTIYYDFDDRVPYDVKVRNLKEENVNHMHFSRMRNSDGFFVNIEAKNDIRVICFNKLEDGNLEIISFALNPKEKQSKKAYKETPCKTLVEALEATGELFPSEEAVFNKTVAKADIAVFDDAVSEILALAASGSEFHTSDKIYAYDENEETQKSSPKKKNKKAKKAPVKDEETYSIQEAVAVAEAAKNDSIADEEEESEFEEGTSEEIES